VPRARLGETANAPALPMPKVYPSGAALATASTPVTPPAPARLSTTTGWPSVAAMRGARTRATMSLGPPAAKGTTKRIARLG
jgi:hypothetical protein